jgi:hypothetical protein
MKLIDECLLLTAIADRWAREIVQKPGPLSSDEIFLELLRSIWRGEFEDCGKKTLFITRPPTGGAISRDGIFVDSEHYVTEQARRTEFGREELLSVLPRPAGFRRDFKKQKPWPKLVRRAAQ